MTCYYTHINFRDEYIDNSSNESFYKVIETNIFDDFVFTQNECKLKWDDCFYIFKCLYPIVESTSKNKLLIENSHHKMCSFIKNLEGKVYQVSIYGPERDNLNISNEESEYLKLLKNILENGDYSDDRTNVGTIYTFGNHLEFDIKNDFPLLTTKKVFFRGIVEELLFFLSGKTDAKILQDKKVRIWDGNSSRDYLDSIGLEHFEEGDLGKFYGFQWRHWNAEYVDCHTDYTGKGIDQIQNVIYLIKNDPNSRRIIITGWNPSDLNQVCLPVCHLLYQFDVNSEKQTLSCNMYQRSADMFLGVPFNIASCALLTYILALHCDLNPGKIRMNFGNTHIYMNHIQQVYEQISRTPYKFPTLTINKKDNLEDYCYGDFVLNDYQCHGKLKGKMAV